MLPTSSNLPISGLSFYIYQGYFQPPSLATGYSSFFASLYNATHGRISAVPVSNISVEWTGFIFIPTESAGLWTFIVITDGDCSVWIDGTQIISSPRYPFIETDAVIYSNSSTLRGGVYYSIVVRYASANVNKAFQFLFTAPDIKMSANFSNIFFYSDHQLFVPTTAPTSTPSAYPIVRPSASPVTLPPSRYPTAAPTLPKNLLNGLLFNVYSSLFNYDPTFFAANVPYVAGYADDFSSLNKATDNQLLFSGDLSVEWFGYLLANTVSDGEWTFQVSSASPTAMFYLWVGDKALTGFETRNADLKQGSASATIPLYAQSYYPIRIQFGGTLAGFLDFSFSFIPSNSKATISSGLSYLFSLRPPEVSVDDVQLLHDFTFDTKHLKGNIVTDSIGGSSAQLRNGVTITEEGAAFNGGPEQYIQLEPSVLSFSEAVTIEVWASFAAGTFNNEATLLSFGPPYDNISLPTDLFTSTPFEGSVYLAAVYSADLFTLYLNGQATFNRSIRFRANLTSMGYNFIGRSVFGGVGSGLTATIQAVRIWYGQLEPTDIFTNYLAGYLTSSLYVTEELSVGDITIIYIATTLQQVQIGFFGGNSSFSPMFGAETSFRLSATDNQCAFSLDVSLDGNTSSTTVLMAAMNYTVSIVSAPLQPPIYAIEGICDPNSQHTSTTCYCADSKPPMLYLQEAGLDKQNITILLANASLYQVTFIYESGVCFQAVGSEELSGTDGNSTVLNGVTYACFPSNGTFLASGSSKGLLVLLFERYPIGVGWLDSNLNPLLISASSGVKVSFDRNISNSIVYISDSVSGKSQNVPFAYNNSLVSSSGPAGLTYTINASQPNPSFPYSKTISITVIRSSLAGPSSVGFSWYLAVLGVIPREVPAFYPIASNPDTIFLVLRDPPGGTSTATIAAGSTISFAMSIDGGNTFDSNYDVNSELGASFKDDSNIITAPLGFGTMETALNVDAGVTVHYGHHFAASASRTSSSEYEYSFYFEYDFSTSSDPNIAGHPSDVIVGGGVDLIVNEAIKGLLYLPCFFFSYLILMSLSGLGEESG